MSTESKFGFHFVKQYKEFVREVILLSLTSQLLPRINYLPVSCIFFQNILCIRLIHEYVPIGLFSSSVYTTSCRHCSFHFHRTVYLGNINLSDRLHSLQQYYIHDRNSSCTFNQWVRLRKEGGCWCLLYNPVLFNLRKSHDRLASGWHADRCVCVCVYHISHTYPYIRIHLSSPCIFRFRR